MNGKYMRQAEMRWARKDAKRLEHIKSKKQLVDEVEAAFAPQIAKTDMLQERIMRLASTCAKDPLAVVAAEIRGEIDADASRETLEMLAEVERQNQLNYEWEMFFGYVRRYCEEAGTKCPPPLKYAQQIGESIAAIGGGNTK